jgi:hypothetical protein
MTAFTFQVDLPERDLVVRTRVLDGEAEALAFAQQLKSDWADYQTIDILPEGELLARLRRRPN